jgi:TonB family protein
MKAALLLVAGLAAVAAEAAPRVAKPPAPAPAWRDGVTYERDACFIARDYAGSARLVVLAQGSGGLWIGAASADWPIEDGVPYPVRVRLDGVEGPSLSVSPRRSAGRRGFVVPVDAEFMRRLARAKQFQLSYGDRAPAAFDLSGISFALPRLRACQLREQATPTTAVASATILEPFLLDAAFPRGARLVAPIFYDEDYPAAALHSGESGSVGFRAEIGPGGRVANCTITVSSGSAVLDSATCRILQARAHFIPALDAAGQPTGDVVTGRINWRLPPD